MMNKDASHPCLIFRNVLILLSVLDDMMNFKSKYSGHVKHFDLLLWSEKNLFVSVIFNFA